MKKYLYSMFLMMFVILATFSFVVADDTVIGSMSTPRALWSPPTTGSPVVYYVLQVWETDGDLIWSVTVADTTVVVEDGFIEPMIRYMARVAGVDAHERQGPWSEWGNDYIYAPGIPESPGTPVWSIEP